MSLSWLASRRLWGAAIGVGLFLALLLAPPLSGLNPAAQRTAAVAALMAAFWIGEVIPIYATALFPIVLFPLLGILDTKAVTIAYADRVVFLMMGGFIIGQAMVKWELHRRIALYTLRLIGGTPERIILGFLLATGCISMWISNTATAVMMMPIALSVIWRAQAVEKMEHIRPDSFSTPLILSIAYGASCGGLATLVGTPPNAIFAGQVKVLFPQAPPVFFVQWMRLGLPLSLVMLFCAWFLLTRVLFRPSQANVHIERGVIREEIQKLGPMSRGEKNVLLVFGLAALLWITRELWSKLLPKGIEVDDSTVSMAAALLLFLLPVDRKHGIFTLEWDSVQRIPWGVLVLFGGGFALAAGLQESGFAQWAGLKLSVLSGVPPLVMVAAICLLVTFLTEVTSNTAVTTMMMPIMAFTAIAMKVHPILLMLPAAISASCAFMLPAGTPPNAIVFGSGLIRLPQMARTGLWFNFIGVVVVTLFVYFLGDWAFEADLFSFPAWAAAPAGAP
jgi:sodium-dependent dicarboxylate transporter 2/3/5